MHFFLFAENYKKNVRLKFLSVFFELLQNRLLEDYGKKIFFKLSLQNPFVVCSTVWKVFFCLIFFYTILLFIYVTRTCFEIHVYQFSTQSVLTDCVEKWCTALCVPVCDRPTDTRVIYEGSVFSYVLHIHNINRK